MKTYAQPRYGATPHPRADAALHPVAIVGAGPVGLALAIDLGQRGVPVVVLDDDDTVSVGSRAICYATKPANSPTRQATRSLPATSRVPKAWRAISRIVSPP